MELKRGQKIWVAISLGKMVIKETVIKSVGSKFITTDYDDRIKFDKNTLTEIDGRGYSSYLILDIEEHRRKQYYNQLVARLQNFDWRIGEEKLDEIAKLLDLPPKQ